MNQKESKNEKIGWCEISNPEIRDLIRFLQSKGDLYAPHKKGEKSFSFEKVNDPDKVVLNYNRTILPLKKFFIPQKEVLLKFNRKSNTFQRPEVENNKRFFFGVHSYDMQGILRLDYSFSRGEPEYNYLTRRENTTFIGITYSPDEYHFSKSVGIPIEEMTGFSLFIDYKEDGNSVIFAVDKEGRDILKQFGKDKLKTDEYEFEKRDFTAKIKYHYNRLPNVFEKSYFSKVWKEVAEKCVACGTCNLVCPTCYCFDVEDDVELDLTNGYRMRRWDGCMLNEFAMVAGGENFREDRSERTRHRLFRKFKYITDFYGAPFCVGCGRCSKYCTANINIVDIVNKLIEECEEKEKVSL